MRRMRCPIRCTGSQQARCLSIPSVRPAVTPLGDIGSRPTACESNAWRILGTHKTCAPQGVGRLLTVATARDAACALRDADTETIRTVGNITLMENCNLLYS